MGYFFRVSLFYSSSFLYALYFIFLFVLDGFCFLSSQFDRRDGPLR
jgi:hypothetical protein